MNEAKDSLDDPPEPMLYAATLVPHRSLGPRAFLLVMLFVSAVSFICGVAFLLMGAWPVFGLFGLDVVALYVAFRMNFRAARAREEIIMTPSRLVVRKIAPNGSSREAAMNPLWTRLHTDRHAEFGLMRVLLTSRGIPTEVGGFLYPEAKEALATDLAGALARAKRGIAFDQT